MNDEEKELDEVRPYKATRNLNTTISNPDINVNDMMNINIKEEKTKLNTDQEVEEKKETQKKQELKVKSDNSSTNKKKKIENKTKKDKKEEDGVSLSKLIKLFVLGILIILTIVLTINLIAKIK